MSRGERAGGASPATGAGPAPLPGLLVEGALAVATLAGGLRRGSAQGEVGLLSGGGPGAAPEPGAASEPGAAPEPGGLAVAAWGDRLIAGGARADVARQIVAAGYSLADFARLDAARGLVTPGLIDAHTHLVFAGTREA